MPAWASAIVHVCMWGLSNPLTKMSVAVKIHSQYHRGNNVNDWAKDFGAQAFVEKSVKGENTHFKCKRLLTGHAP